MFATAAGILHSSQSHAHDIYNPHQPTRQTLQETRAMVQSISSSQQSHQDETAKRQPSIDPSKRNPLLARLLPPSKRRIRPTTIPQRIPQFPTPPFHPRRRLAHLTPLEPGIRLRDLQRAHDRDARRRAARERPRPAVIARTVGRRRR